MSGLQGGEVPEGVGGGRAEQEKGLVKDRIEKSLSSVIPPSYPKLIFLKN